MKFNIIDTESIYRRLLDAPDAAARESIFRKELAEPFSGMIANFGGGDLVEALARWNMSPEQFAGENRAKMAASVETLAAAKAWQQAADALNEGWAAFAHYHDRIPTEQITFALTLADMGSMPGNAGYAGFGAMPGYIMTTYDQPNEDNLRHLKGATVHELHHNILFTHYRRNFMFETTVGEYMVIEGLAESFAAELYGAAVVGPYVTAFDEARLDEAKAVMRDGLEKTGFNVIRAYIFGDEIAAQGGMTPVGVPPYAGYALGYRVVQAYLKRSGSGVVDATFVPLAEIIAESGYFSGLS